MSDRFQVLDTTIDGPLLIQPKVIGDERGFFCETYRRNEFMQLGIEEEMVQDNHSRSGHGIVRGMHFQIGRGAAKLVRCARGTIYDVVVDLRRDSDTYKEWVGVELSADNRRALFVPEGFAHGYQTLVPDAEVFYQVSEYYTPGAEGGVRWDDRAFGIEWPDPDNAFLSDKDRSWPDFSG
jgi:dTDP-4-dehydrorhamnose 3,5-epimerase